MRVLIFSGHPDDEILWFWPVLQGANHEVAVLAACRNAHKGAGPEWALKNVCAVNWAEYLGCVLEHNQFYRQPTRYIAPTLMDVVVQLRTAIQRAIDTFKPDAIFTHNPWGEYGHGDHRLCFEIASRFELPLLLTDMCQPNRCHPSADVIPAFYRRVFAEDEVVQAARLDEAWYEKMKGIYEKSNAWTWGGHEPVREAGLYLFPMKTLSGICLT